MGNEPCAEIGSLFIFFFFFQRLLKTTLSQKTLYSQVIKHDYEMEVKWGEGWKNKSDTDKLVVSLKSMETHLMMWGGEGE